MCLQKSITIFSLFKCFRISNLLEFEAWPASDIDKKMLLFPQGKYYAAIPLLHYEKLYVQYISKIFLT